MLARQRVSATRRRRPAMSSDAVVIRGLRVDARVGVTDAERSRPQTVVVDVVASCDLRSASVTDDLADTIDYGFLVTEVARAVGSSEAKLLERLADAVAERVLGVPGVTKVVVEISKQSPPIDETVERVAVRIGRP